MVFSKSYKYKFLIIASLQTARAATTVRKKYMNKKIIQDENIRQFLMKNQKPPIPRKTNEIIMKELPPDKTKELLDSEDGNRTNQPD